MFPFDDVIVFPSLCGCDCISISNYNSHYIDVIMSAMTCQITTLTVVYSTVYSDTDQRKHHSSASLAFVWGIHRDRWIPHTKGQSRGKCFHLMTSSWDIIFFSKRSLNGNVIRVIDYVYKSIPLSGMRSRWKIFQYTGKAKSYATVNRKDQNKQKESARITGLTPEVISYYNMCK